MRMVASPVRTGGGISRAVLCYRCSADPTFWTALEGRGSCSHMHSGGYKFKQLKGHTKIQAEY